MMSCLPSIDASCEKIVTNVSCGVRSVICPVILAKYCHVTENYDWHYRGYLEPLGTRATRRPNHLPSSLSPVWPRLSSRLITLGVYKSENIQQQPLSLPLLSEAYHWDWGDGTCVILTHLSLTLDWHEYLFSYKRCKSFPQLNCDADKSCHNKQYLWLRRLWAIVALVAL